MSWTVSALVGLWILLFLATAERDDDGDGQDNKTIVRYVFTDSFNSAVVTNRRYIPMLPPLFFLTFSSAEDQKSSR